MAGKRKTNPAGSTNSYRGDVLRVLGALKVATADQIQRIGAPHLTFRHADKETPSKQKQAPAPPRTPARSPTCASTACPRTAAPPRRATPCGT